MKLILPMAGDSFRFRELSAMPKYLIDVAGESMLAWGMKGTSFKAKDIVAIVREDHCAAFDVESALRRHIGEEMKIVKVRPTRGAAETVMMGIAQGNVSSSEPICIKDIDCLSVPAQGWQREVELQTGESCWVGTHGDGQPLSATTTNKSHVRLGVDGNILEIKEKSRLSPWFVAGWYLFSSAALFQKWAGEILRNPPNGEYYLSHVVAHGIQKGASCRPLPINKYADLGTPQVLAEFLNGAHSFSI